MSVDEVQKLAYKVNSWGALYKMIFKVNSYPNNSSRKKLIEEYKDLIDHSHFRINGAKKLYKDIISVCPVCGKKFSNKSGGTDKRKTCSHSCSNTYFRTGYNHGNFSGNNYRLICFLNHKRECVICGESRIVEVHHYDENKENNDPCNLVPLCPTHHQYWHSKYKKLVKPKVDEYIRDYKTAIGSVADH